MKFKPKLTDIIKEYEMDPIVLIPKNKGLLNDIIKKIMRNFGIETNLEEMDKNNYKNGQIEIFPYKGEDIPQIVEDIYFTDRRKAIGLTGDDLYDEYKLKNLNTIVEILETIDWYDDNAKFKRPTLCLIQKNEQKLNGKVNIAIEKKYEFTGRKYIKEINNGDFEPNIRIYSGNSEQTVKQGINDACIDVVYSGATIDESDLVIADKIRFSDFVIIGVNEKSPKVFERDYKIIQNRIKNPREDSYTTKLANNGREAMKKINEEIVEYVEACISGDKNNIIAEYADVIYTVSINAVMKGINFEDITKEMYRRIKED